MLELMFYFLAGIVFAMSTIIFAYITDKYDRYDALFGFIINFILLVVTFVMVVINYAF